MTAGDLSGSAYSGQMDTFLQHWTITIFLPAVLIGLAVLVMVVGYKDRHEDRH